MQWLHHDHAEAHIGITTKINFDEHLICCALTQGMKQSDVLAADESLYITLFDAIAANTGVGCIHGCAVTGHVYSRAVHLSKPMVTGQLVTTLFYVTNKNIKVSSLEMGAELHVNPIELVRLLHFDKELRIPSRIL